METQVKTIIFSKELDTQLEQTLALINANRITGELSKSKIIRIAVAEWLDRQQRALAIIKEDQNVNKTAEELLKENGYA